MFNVFVISKTGKPLMPCTACKCRKLLKAKKAKVIKRYPFTIQLLFDCEEKVQDITLGIDSGYQNIGFSAVSEKKELFSGTLVLDPKTKDRLTEKRMYRRTRRNRLRYRKPRFDNRKRSEDWLPPSIQRRYDTHLRLLDRIKKILPISKVVIETANFDIQKIENPEIKGIKYQQGDLYGYQNVRSYLMAREKGLCQLCGKEFNRTNPSHIHHIKPKSQSGTNRTKNLALLHEKCHEKLHKKGLYKGLKRNKEYKSNTFMSIIHKRFWEDIPNLKMTYGYITFLKRQELNIEKSHSNDAFIITGGSKQIRNNPIEITQKHRNNRRLGKQRKGFAPASRKQRYKIQPKDLVWINGVKYISKGCGSCGKIVLIEGIGGISIKKIERYYNFGSFTFNNN